MGDFMYYTTKDGTKIEIGTSRFYRAMVVVTVLESGKKYDCPLSMNEDNDVGFIFKGEKILFRCLQETPD